MGETFDFGSFSLDPSKESLFTIENTGTALLSLSEDSPVSLDGAGDFILSSIPERNLRPGESTPFSLEFEPLSEGEKSAIVRVAGKESDEALFEFVVKGAKLSKSEFTVSPDVTVYFAGPLYDSAMEDALIEKISSNSAEAALDLCIYGLSRESIISAMEEAIERGVHVRFVGNRDGDGTVSSGEGSYYEGYRRIARALDERFPEDGKERVNFPDDSGFDDFVLINEEHLMHNKFALFTGSSGKRSVFAGSTNFTDSGFAMNNNNSLLISDDDLFFAYRQQFEYLLGLPGSECVSGLRSFAIDDIQFDLIFSPGNGVMDYLVSEVNRPGTVNINFMIFSFTHEDLVNAMIERYEGGASVMGIFDESQLLFSSEEILARYGIPCRVDGNHYVEYFHGGKLHHKVMILNDERVVTGSYNWSFSADEYNDENLLVVNSSSIAGIYKEEWQRRWDEGRDITPVSPDPSGYDYAEEHDVLINEVMWMGSRKDYDAVSSADEFIELRNMTDSEINLNGWIIEGAAAGGKALVLSNCSILPGGYLVIMGLAAAESAFRPGSPDLYIVKEEMSISNSVLSLVLKDPADTVIDCAGNGGEGEDFAGYNGTDPGELKKSMARIEQVPGGANSGDDPANWITSNTQVNISSEYGYSLYNCATPAADNSAGALVYASLDIVFSEIAWAGTDVSFYDEWFELYNNTGIDINLAGWHIGGGLDIQLSGILPAYSHLLFERTDDDSVPAKTADIIYTGSLGNDGEDIILYYNTVIIDEVCMSAGWAAGSNDPKISMERFNVNLSGSSDNWIDGAGDVEGAENSSD